MNKLTNFAVSSVVVGGLAFGLVGCNNDAPDDFQKRCDKANGKVMREDDFEGETLGMAPVAFVAGKGGGGSRGGSGSKSGGSKSSKGSKSKGLGMGSGENSKPKPKKSKKSKKHDNEWICVKNDEILFEED
ncbi:hypothetical protein SEA_WOFFORD_209 [Streptomyces phage Wofford]|uniref:Lipoprotein n=1 Tax=Streptomyces phage Wofford TaxID=2283267 RepID=A0A345MA30_9CAUD|nr:hypothetical protein HWB78_gp104 [Streptomyces phage Wollford]AXH67351.1 hypothetical protein SEA_WOFFORD_209 [Streptomyces phage Wollford]